MTSPLLGVDGLRVAYGATPAVHGASFVVERGQSVALIGESGSGKSTIARAVLRLLPEGSALACGTVAFEGENVLAWPEKRFRPLRGREIGFVPQDPGNSLNPVRTVGSQALEAAALSGATTATAQRSAVLEAFERVGLPDPQRVYDAYPHQLSGGMLQRVLIGLAVLPGPKLLVADEPTSALDVTIQKRILDLLDDLRASLDIGLLLITHDLAIAAERTDAIVVLKDGAVQESGPTARVFGTPTSDYTVRLQGDAPALNPDRYREVRRTRGEGAEQPRVDVRNVTKSFGAHEAKRTVLSEVSFSVPAGTTHALVGESGSGKTTSVRLLLGLEEPDAGELVVGGRPVRAGSRAALRDIRRHLQLVYQNPFTSLDPSWSVERIVREPLDQYRVGSKKERRAGAVEALGWVGLGEAFARRRPADLSGGQRQRVAIARALVLHPDVIVLDEPTSALDVSVQAEIFDVLFRLQRERGLTYLFVSHDLALVRQVADSVSVLKDGRVVEAGPVAEVLERPRQQYTRDLIDAVPRPPRALVGASAAAEGTP